MRKYLEVTDPNSCLSKAGMDDYLFVLIQKDPAFAATVRFWARERIRLGLNEPNDRKIQAAFQTADTVEKLQCDSARPSVAPSDSPTIPGDAATPKSS